jgi:hypothetical protein
MAVYDEYVKNSGVVADPPEADGEKPADGEAEASTATACVKGSRRAHGGTTFPFRFPRIPAITAFFSQEAVFHGITAMLSA